MFVGTGFIIQLIYASGGGSADSFALLTEASDNILTEIGQDIDTEN